MRPCLLAKKTYPKQKTLELHPICFSGGLAGIGKLPALVSWYIWYGITAYTNFLPLA
jgi:hypothetical protein